MGAAGAHGIHLGNDAGELTAGALHLHAGLDHILDRGDANALAGSGNVKAELLDPLPDIVILVHESLNGFRIHEERSVFYLAFV